MDNYTVEGAGDPLVLLHGGLSDSTSWAFQQPVMAAAYRTLAFDRRGHGRAPDTEAPFDYEDMADETIAFLEDVVGEPAHLVGWSDGGNVALLVSSKRPHLVRRQVLISANFHHNGLVPGFELPDDPDHEALAMMKAGYEAVAPDPSHWPVFFAKSVENIRTRPTLTPSDLANVTTPTLVLAGDDDIIEHSHTVELFESLPDAQLAIVPGTSHVLVMEKPDLVNQLILAFLAETARPETMLPIRRAAAH